MLSANVDLNLGLSASAGAPAGDFCTAFAPNPILVGVRK